MRSSPRGKKLREGRRIAAHGSFRSALSWLPPCLIVLTHPNSIGHEWGVNRAQIDRAAVRSFRPVVANPAGERVLARLAGRQRDDDCGRVSGIRAERDLVSPQENDHRDKGYVLVAIDERMASRKA